MLLLAGLKRILINGGKKDLQRWYSGCKLAKDILAQAPEVRGAPVCQPQNKRVTVRAQIDGVA